MWWVPAWEVLRGTVLHEHPWEVTPAICLHRDPDKTGKEERPAAGKAATEEELQGEWLAPAPASTATHPKVADWSDGTQVTSAPGYRSPTEGGSARPATEDWAAAPAAWATEWLGTMTERSPEVPPQILNRQ